MPFSASRPWSGLDAVVARTSRGPSGRGRASQLTRRGGDGCMRELLWNTPTPPKKKNTAPLPSATQCGCLLCIGVLKCIPINISFFYFTLLWVWRRDSYCRCKTANKSNAFGSAKTGGILIALYLFHYTQEICLCVDRNQTVEKIVSRMMEEVFRSYVRKFKLVICLNLTLMAYISHRDHQ